MPKKKKAAKKKKKKALKKKTAPKKKTPKKKKTTKIKAAKKKPARKKAAAKKPKKTAPKKAVRAVTPEVKPGPPSMVIPPVEEPPSNEEAVGVVTHYYSHLSVAVVQVNKGSLKTGDMVHIKGHTTDFTQTIGSMEYEHAHIDEAPAGRSVGLKVKDHAREHDIVYIVK